MKNERTKAQRAAEARYDQKRRGLTITLRLSSEQAAWLGARRKPGDSRPAALRRLARMPDTPPNAGVERHPKGVRSDDELEGAQNGELT